MNIGTMIGRHLHLWGMIGRYLHLWWQMFLQWFAPVVVESEKWTRYGFARVRTGRTWSMLDGDRLIVREYFGTVLTLPVFCWRSVELANFGHLVSYGWRLHVVQMRILPMRHGFEFSAYHGSKPIGRQLIASTYFFDAGEIGPGVQWRKPSVASIRRAAARYWQPVREDDVR